MSAPRAEVVVCGAGIAGIAAAHHLVVHHGLRDVVLVDELAPMSLTSDKSTECYRNWWPGPGDAMVSLVNRSIDLMEALARESDNRFRLNRRGYLFATAEERTIAEMERAAAEAESLGAGAARRHEGAAAAGGYRPAPAEGFEGQPDGSDLILDRALIRSCFPCLSPDTVAVLHARRCGWLSAQQLGACLLERATAGGLRRVRARVTAVDAAGGAVRALGLEAADGSSRLETRALVVAAGPLARDVARLLDVDLPLVCERHVKLSIADRAGAVDRDAPLLIWCDPVSLAWTGDEREALAADAATRYLLEPFPAGVHGRPEGRGDQVLLYWTYDDEVVEPVFPLEWDPHTPEIVLRGMARMVPALAGYFGRLPRPYVDGGYYAKTPENRPLIGPLPVDGAYVSGGYSGFGIMAALAGGELVAAHVTGAALPHYADAFVPSRYHDPAYRALLDDWPASGQL